MDISKISDTVAWSFSKMVQGGGQEGDQSYGFPERQVEVEKASTGQEKLVFGEGGPGSGMDSA